MRGTLNDNFVNSRKQAEISVKKRNLAGHILEKQQMRYIEKNS